MSRRYELNFRQEEISYIMQKWTASSSCSLVGVGSVGKSNLLHHLITPEVQAHYIPNVAEKVKPIIIDANLLGALPALTSDTEPFRCWAGYELLMHRLFTSFYPFDVLEEADARQFYEVYQMLQDGTNPLFTYMGVRYFELGLEFFMRKGIRIVFIFDEFEELLRQIPPKFFQTLRGIRDSHKSQISYLTFTRAPLPVVVERLGIDLLHIEAFIELFNDNVVYVGPYNDVDAWNMLLELARKNRTAYSQPVLITLMQASGRYAGLMRAGFFALETLTNINLSDQTVDSLAAALLTRMSIQTECRTIWLSLTLPEQHMLKAIAGLLPFTMSPEAQLTINMLVKKRLVHVDTNPQGLHIEPPVFRVFVQSDPE